MIRDMAHQQLPRRIASEGFVEGHLEPEAPVAGHEPGGHGERPSHRRQRRAAEPAPLPPRAHDVAEQFLGLGMAGERAARPAFPARAFHRQEGLDPAVAIALLHVPVDRSEEHTSELQSLMRTSYAVFCLKKKNINITPTTNIIT